MSNTPKIDKILYWYASQRDVYYSDLEEEVITDKEWEAIRDEIQRQAKNQLYQLLMEEVITLWHDGSDLNRKLPKPVKAIPISAINKLFGKE